MQPDTPASVRGTERKDEIKAREGGRRGLCLRSVRGRVQRVFSHTPREAHGSLCVCVHACIYGQSLFISSFRRDRNNNRKIANTHLWLITYWKLLTRDAKYVNEADWKSNCKGKRDLVVFFFLPLKVTNLISHISQTSIWVHSSWSWKPKWITDIYKGWCVQKNCQSCTSSWQCFLQDSSKASSICTSMCHW